VIDGKARLVSDLMCDGLGACIGHCPQGAITIGKREAEPYNETKVMEIMLKKGQNTVIAHLKHLKEHNEKEFLKEAVQFMLDREDDIDFDVNYSINQVYNTGKTQNQTHPHSHTVSGCPGSQSFSFNKGGEVSVDSVISGKSQLQQWPVQMHLINPAAAYFRGADLLLAADCVAFSMGNFHDKYLQGRKLAIACPKLDSGMEIYLEKLTRLINEAEINTITVMIMQVPCCRGLLQLAKSALEHTERNVPVKAIVVSVEGDILKEEWI
jgi:ferredoxin